MIALIEGQVFAVEHGYAIVMVGGVGYQVHLCKKNADALITQQTVTLHVHTHVREDAIELYGFLSSLERSLFLLLISVSGVGPKLALGILSHLLAREVIDAIIDKDIATLSGVSGIGKKTAERLSLELKDKVIKLDYFRHDSSPPISVRLSLEQAIKSLGYSKAQSDRAILLLDQEDFASLPLEELIKKTLNNLSGN